MSRTHEKTHILFFSLSWMVMAIYMIEADGSQDYQAVELSYVVVQQ